MLAATLDAFQDELTKIAFGKAEANKVLSLAKKMQLPKASGRVVPVLSGSPAPKQLLKGTVQSIGRIGPSMGDLGAQALSEARGTPAFRLIQKTQKPTIFPGSSSVESSMNLTNRSAVPASQRKMLHAVVKGHERDEALAAGRLGAGHLGHRDPEVLYKEHNRLATLPKKGFQKLKKFMIGQREAHGDTQLFPKQIPYGTGARLSRHARKRLAELHENKTINAVRHALENAPKE